MASLSTSSNSGEQTTTQSPQASVGSAPATANASSVQPGTAAAVLTSQNGQTLHPTSLNSVTLGASSTQTVAATAQPAPAKHFNYGLGGVAVVLFLVAVLLFWTTSRSVKSTTKY
jgi:hypothetical protein